MTQLVGICIGVACERDQETADLSSPQSLTKQRMQRPSTRVVSGYIRFIYLFHGRRDCLRTL
ncbi:hypothetical protein E2C01_045550 [Portunus trituberculatus]|uniref:Uncharacterized protein n=1 Tax=Portunus trituberculatus TaxID=210409 RepID=A0A5B7G3F5_PORTR|nr:hypothetical protein [Portunus trituberculatus]